jgi:ribonuclease-3
MKDTTKRMMEKLGYDFHDPQLLENALTHSSYAIEGNRGLKSNERLEFLGDSVLSIITSRYLYQRFSDCPEGELTRMRAEVVCERALSGYANVIGLGNYLLLGIGEEKNNGRTNKSITADSFEAVLAAMCLDAAEDGFNVAEKLVLPFVSAEIEEILKKGNVNDYKTRLQTFIQQSGEDRLEYVVVDEQGPAHDKTFTIEARLNSNIIGRGVGSSKRKAEQNAAREALILFGEKD